MPTCCSAATTVQDVKWIFYGFWSNSVGPKLRKTETSAYLHMKSYFGHHPAIWSYLEDKVNVIPRNGDVKTKGPFLSYRRTLAGLSLSKDVGELLGRAGLLS